MKMSEADVLRGFLRMHDSREKGEELTDEQRSLAGDAWEVLDWEPSWDDDLHVVAKERLEYLEGAA